MPTRSPSAATPAQKEDRRAFAALFLDPTANHQKIWTAMVALILDVSGGVNFRSEADRDEARGEALLHAMNLVKKYDAARGSAFYYFWGIIERRLIQLAKKRSAVHAEYVDEAISFDALSRIAPEDIDLFRSDRNAAKNWRTFRIKSERDRRGTGNYLDGVIARARKVAQATESDAERTAASVIVACAMDARRNLLGPSKSPERSPRLQAASVWLAKVLRRGPVPAADVLARAKERGISRHAIYQAKDAIGAQTEQIAPSEWYWRLENTHRSADMPENKQLSKIQNSLNWLDSHP